LEFDECGQTTLVFFENYTVQRRRSQNARNEGTGGGGGGPPCSRRLWICRNAMDLPCRAAGRRDTDTRGDPRGHPYSRKGGDAAGRVNKEGRERESGVEWRRH
jgi:hypothetical protein